jgi:hypothetical protein
MRKKEQHRREGEERGVGEDELGHHVSLSLLLEHDLLAIGS